MGSWVTYGLGSESDDLPGFVVLTSLAGSAASRSRSRRGSGTAASCPASSRASSFTRKGDPVHYVSNPPGVDRAAAARRHRRGQRAQPPARRGRRRSRDRHAHRQYEMAFRMQTSVPELMDIADEPQHVLDLYGVQGRRRLVRVQLPAGPPAGRARRAVHPALPPRLGPPRRPQARTSRACAEEVDQADAPR